MGRILRNVGKENVLVVVQKSWRTDASSSVHENFAFKNNARQTGGMEACG